MGRFSVYMMHAALFLSAPFILWQGFVWLAQPKPYVFASPSQALSAMVGPRASLVWNAFLESLHVLAWALPLAILAGLSLALVFGLYRRAFLFAMPMLVGLFAVPVYGLNRALYSVTQVGFETKVFVAALILYFPVLIAALVGLRSIDPAVLEAAKLDGASRLRILTAVMLPLAGPALAGGLMAAGAVAPLALLAAEQSGSSGGLGPLIISQFNQSVDVAFAGIALLIVIGLCLFAAADGARRLLSSHSPDTFQLLRN